MAKKTWKDLSFKEMFGGVAHTAKQLMAPFPAPNGDPRLEKMPDPSPPKPYETYTTKFDKVILAENIDSIIGMDDHALWDSKKHYYREWGPKQQKTALAKLNQQTRSYFEQTKHPTRKDTIVSLLIDHSGSLRGGDATFCCAATQVICEFLQEADITHEVLGFTTSSWVGGKSRDEWLQHKTPYPGRLCDLLHIIYRAADETKSSPPTTLLNLLRDDLLKENIDGEAVLWAHDRLMNRPEKNKILFVISDGAPVDDSTLTHNGLNILHNHLKEVVSTISDAGQVHLAGVGIGHDLTRYYYGTSLKLDTKRTIPKELLEFVVSVITNKALPN